MTIGRLRQRWLFGVARPQSTDNNPRRMESVIAAMGE
jgi:hypothetical protein